MRRLCSTDRNSLTCFRITEDRYIARIVRLVRTEFFRNLMKSLEVLKIYQAVEIKYDGLQNLVIHAL